jgi:hypothetical protein
VEVIGSTTFDRSTLRERLEPPEVHFARLLSSGVAQRHAWARQILVAQRELVCEVWQDGDELWSWQTTPHGGAFGLLVLRGGDLVRVWYIHTIL